MAEDVDFPLLVRDLRGELGAGKTCWVRGLARGLGVVDLVRSPTFTICTVHRGRVRLFHLDAYRLEDPEELLEQGWDEMTLRGVVAVEWGERIAELLPADRLSIELAHAPGGRTIRLRALGPRAREILTALGDLPRQAGDESGCEPVAGANDNNREETP